MKADGLKASLFNPENARRLRLYAQLIRFDKPIGTYLLLWPTLWALWIAAEGVPHLGVLTVFVLGVFLMRSAGCVINDYADREIDPRVNRTKDRPIASGKVSPDEAMARIDSLSDEELAKIFKDIENIADLPAGGNAVGFIVIVAAVVLIAIFIVEYFSEVKMFGSM